MKKLPIKHPVNVGYLRLRESSLTLQVVRQDFSAGQGQNGDHFRLQQRDWNDALGYESGRVLNSIDLTRAEFIAILRFGLMHLNVDTKLIESVVPKLSKANIVR
jgi:hypothetical protein